jgi:predicted  nucleic acid-binding Zn-ribbon protein
MIITFLIVLVVALIIGNILVSIAMPKKRKEKGFTYMSVDQVHEPEVVQNNSLEIIHEKTSMMDSKLISINQKLALMNERIAGMEKAMTEMIDQKIKAETNQLLGQDVDMEKIDFRIKVLEQQIDDIKNPKEKPNTFYGKLDPEMEKTVKSLAFNTKKESGKN